MISFIKNNSVKSVFVILLSIILSLNYSGFCFSQFRFLSDEEKRELVLNYILSKEKNTLKELQIFKQLNNSELKQERMKYLPKEPVPYQSIEEFIILNPNCCQVTINYTSTGGEGNTVNCWDRLKGWSTVVGIKYMSRYRDEKGIIMYKKVEIFPIVSNCGELIWELG